MNNISTDKDMPCVHVLMYHSISNEATDPWGICVSPQHFEEHIQFLQQHCKVIGTTELIQQLKCGGITENAVCLTFDDGYADNYVNAKPVLEKYGCPATFFIPTAFINSQQPFWWDVLEIIFLQLKNIPEVLNLKINTDYLSYFFNAQEITEQQWQQHKQWKWFDEPPTERCKAFLQIWNLLRPLAYNEIQTHIDTFMHWAGIDNSYFTQRLPMNEQQLHEMRYSDHFTIGLHTHTHVDLRAADLQTQCTEITDNKNSLLNSFHIAGNVLAYPYGRYNNNTLTAVEQLKMAACFTTDAAIITKHSALNKLGRFQVFNTGASQFDCLLNKLNMFT